MLRASPTLERMAGPRPNFLTSLLGKLGDWAAFSATAVVRMLKPPLELPEVARQVQKVGFDSAPLIALSGLAVGAVMSMHTRSSRLQCHPDGIA